MQHEIRKRSGNLRGFPGLQLAVGRFRRFIPAARVPIRPPFIFFLQRDSGKRVCRIREITGPYVDQDAAVRLAAVAPAVAHTVRDHSALLRGGADNFATRAHAERINAPAVGRPVSEFIVGRRKRWMAVSLTIIRPVDHFLRMLYAHAHGKRLGFHGDSLRIERPHGIAGAVPKRQHQGLAGNARADSPGFD